MTYDLETVKLMEAKGFLTLKAAGLLVRTKPNTLAQAIARGRLPAIRFRGRIFVGREALIIWLGADAAKILGIL